MSCDNAYTSTRMRESGFFRRIMPTLPTSRDYPAFLLDVGTLLCTMTIDPPGLPYIRISLGGSVGHTSALARCTFL